MLSYKIPNYVSLFITVSIYAEFGPALAEVGLNVFLASVGKLC